MTTTVDTYRGESIAKKLARAHLWVRAIDHVGCRASGARFLVLASREGGDAAALKALGVRADQILAVERSRSAADAFAAAHPDVPLLVCDVRDVLAERKGGFDVVYLDFCAPMNEETYGLYVLGMFAVRDGGLLAGTFLRGRDHEWAEAAKRAHEAHGLPVLADRRFFLVQSALWANGPRGRVAAVPRPEMHVLYQSRDAHSNGSPMLVHAAECRRLGPVSLRSYQRSAEKFYLARARELTSKGCPPPLDLRELGSTPLDAVVAADKLATRFGDAAAGILNVSAGTLAAWRAHATRGTYS